MGKWRRSPLCYIHGTASTANTSVPVDRMPYVQCPVGADVSLSLIARWICRWLPQMLKWAENDRAIAAFASHMISAWPVAGHWFLIQAQRRASQKNVKFLTQGWFVDGGALVMWPGMLFPEQSWLLKVRRTPALRRSFPTKRLCNYHICCEASIHFHKTNIFLKFIKIEVWSWRQQLQQVTDLRYPIKLMFMIFINQGTTRKFNANLQFCKSGNKFFCNFFSLSSGPDDTNQLFFWWRCTL